MFTVIFKILILFLIFSISAIAGGTGALQGTVYDSATNEPIYGASITIRGTEKSVMSGIDGQYSLKYIKPGKYSIIARSKGYFGIIISEINIISDSNIIIDIFFDNRPGFKSGWKIIDAPTQLGRMIYVDRSIMSLAFDSADFIPMEFTCDGNNISPELLLTETKTRPNRPQSMALSCDDPDAPGGTWVHWVIFNLPARHITLPENINKILRPDIGLKSTDIQPIQGINDFGKIGYGGPCPPIGPAHRYFFRLYALDTALEFDEADIQKGITKDMLLKAMDGHILSESVLMGKYKR